MNHVKHVFLSHSSQNLELTESICRNLEAAGVKCWYSERDLDTSSATWSNELMRALLNSKAVIAVLTSAAYASPQVLCELSNAIKRNIPITPYICENSPIPLAFEYFVTPSEWILAYDRKPADSLAVLQKRFTGRAVAEMHETATVESTALLQMEAACFDGIQGGSYGIGYNKCYKKNNNLGWSPDEVYMEEVIDEEFTFSSIGHPEYDALYQEFCNSAEYKKIESRNNNHERWMLFEIYQNDKLYLTLQRTKWSVLTFWWNQVRNHPDMQRKMARYTFSEEGPLFPSSLCMHLILETADHRVIGTKISQNKRNDYSYTIAITLGEQLERSDFSTSYLNNNSFIHTWCKRTCMEELGFSNDEYLKYVDESSIRVLGVTYEADIYNFALPVLVRLKLNFEDFLKLIKQSPMSSIEFTDIIAYTSEEILTVLHQASDPETQRKYHPSSFLRMLLYVAYQNPSLLQS